MQLHVDDPALDHEFAQQEEHCVAPVLENWLKEQELHAKLPDVLLNLPPGQAWQFAPFHSYPALHVHEEAPLPAPEFTGQVVQVLAPHPEKELLQHALHPVAVHPL